jgi:cytosine/adenosine deaminase-related metal-dependent hydrolase
MLGTDGLHGDLLRSARAAYLCGQAVGGFDPAGAWQALWNGRRYLATHHPAAARDNDVVLLDYAPPTPLTAANLPGHACFGLDARHVRTVIAGGRVVLRDGQFTVIDEHATLAHCREQAGRLWRALAKEPAP